MKRNDPRVCIWGYNGKTTERYATIKSLGKRACVRSKRSLKGSLLILQRDAKRLPSLREDSDQYSGGDCGSCDELDIHKICRRFFTVQDMPCLANWPYVLWLLYTSFPFPIRSFMGISIVSGVRAAQFIPIEFARPASRSLEIFRFLRALYWLK